MIEDPRSLFGIPFSSILQSMKSRGELSDMDIIDLGNTYRDAVKHGYVGKRVTPSERIANALTYKMLHGYR